MGRRGLLHRLRVLDQAKHLAAHAVRVAGGLGRQLLSPAAAACTDIVVLTGDTGEVRLVGEGQLGAQSAAVDAAEAVEVERQPRAPERPPRTEQPRAIADDDGPEERDELAEERDGGHREGREEPTQASAARAAPPPYRGRRRGDGCCTLDPPKRDHPGAEEVEERLAHAPHRCGKLWHESGRKKGECM